MTAAEITLGAVVCALWAVFLILSAIGTVVTHKDAKKKAAEQQPAPTGKPLDLKNRNKKPAEAPTDQEQEKAEAAAGELVPGRDFDPETGEVFENGRPPVDQPTTTEQPKSNQHKVITMGPKAVNA